MKDAHIKEEGKSEGKSEGKRRGKGREEPERRIRHLHQKPIPLNMPEPSINFFSIKLRRQGGLSLISFLLPLILYQCYLPLPLPSSHCSTLLPRSNTFCLYSLRFLKISQHSLPMFLGLLSLPAVPPFFMDSINTTNSKKILHSVFNTFPLRVQGTDLLSMTSGLWLVLALTRLTGSSLLHGKGGHGIKARQGPGYILIVQAWLHVLTWPAALPFLGVQNNKQMIE